MKKEIKKNNKEKAESIAVCKEVEKNGRHKYEELKTGFTACICGRAIAFDAEVAKQNKKEVKKLEKEMAKEIETSTKEKESDSWVKSIDFGEIFRIKGEKGLYSPCTERNKAGMVLFEEFLNPENRIWRKASLSTSLNDYHFYLDNGGALTIYGVFENIEKNYDQILKDWQLKTVLNLIVPDYDPEKFKFYHAEKVIDWFNYMKEKMVAYVEEGEAEIAAEETEVEQVKED